MRTKIIALLVGVFLLVGAPAHAQPQTQDPIPPDEPDTAAFIHANFHLQTSYHAVLCVEGDTDCPTEITTRVPCLTVDCTNADQSYAITETFDTIQAASDAAQAGDLIIIMPGHHAGVEVDSIGGDEGAYIHFLGWGDSGSVVIDAPADPDKGYLRHHFYFVDAHYYIIQNLAFEGAERAGIFVTGYFEATGHFSHHFVVMDVYSHDNGSWGLHTTSTNYMLIQDSYFTHSGEEHGAYISGSGDHMVIRRNVFQGNMASGLQVNADPQSATMNVFYWLQEATGDTCGLSEEEVDFAGSATWDDIKACYDSQGLPDLGEFFEDGISENVIIEQNIITGNGEAGGAGINLASVRNSIVRNNLIYGNGAAALACWDNAYAEDKGLDTSEFGCHDVRILNNTMVDASGGRGSLILNNDARNMLVFNNVIIRERDDAYELANHAGEGLQSGNNYYSARYDEESPEASPESNSITGFTVAEGLAQFSNPNFEAWIVEDGTWPALNPNRPDYHPVAGSVLVTGGNPDHSSVLDLTGQPLVGTEIGAFAQQQ
ncbi:MAG: right-handed parallel beta-helix repeat-containing protein [Anaerolineae bacterium]|nr:right-handed parallel beta-helix repeat-containing protein [Anaerolineae bacterium]